MVGIEGGVIGIFSYKVFKVHKVPEYSTVLSQSEIESESVQEKQRSCGIFVG